MAEEKITPEEKLLKIIENPAIEKSKGRAGAAKSIAVPAPAFAAFLRGLLANKEISRYISLQTANKALAVVCACLTVYALYNYLAFNNGLAKKYEKITTDTAVYKPSAQTMVIPEVNAEDLISDYRARNIFSFTPPGVAEKSAQQKDISQLASNLKLVGVIWSDTPQAMIEDAQGGKTYLVSAGEYVGQLKINKITRNSVFIGKDQEEWELR